MTKQKSPETLRLKECFNALALSLDEIENITGVPKRTITNYLWNDQHIGGTLLRQLQRRFNVSVDWLLSGEGSMFLKDDSPSNVVTLREVGNTTSFDDAPLIDTKMTLDNTDFGDVYLLFAGAIERALRDAGSIPERDYTVLDLFTLAQPHVLAECQKTEIKVKFFHQ